MNSTARMAESNPSAISTGAAAVKPDIGRGSAGAWWMVAVLLALYILSLVDRGAVTLLVVPIQKQLGLSDIEMGIILGPAFAISYSLFGIPMGWASDRFPRRWIVFIAIIIWSAATTASGLATSFATLLLARIFVGVGEAALSPNAYSLIADAFPERRLTLALSVYQMGSKLGAGVSFTVVTLAAGIAAFSAQAHWPVVGQLQPWQLTLMLSSLPGFLIAFLIFTFREPTRRQRAVPAANATPDATGFVAYLRGNIAVLGLIMAGMMLISLGVLATGSWAPTFVERHYGLKPQQYGPIMAMLQFVAAGTLVFKGMFVDWLHARGIADAHMRFLSWLALAAVPLVLIAFLTNSLTLFWICYALVEIMAGQFVTYIAATTQLIVPTRFRGRTMAIYQAGFTIGGMGTGPLVVAFVTERVFGDPMRLGQSVAIVGGAAFALAFIVIRIALPSIRRALEGEARA